MAPVPPNFNPFAVLNLPPADPPPVKEILASLRRATFRRLVESEQMSPDQPQRINVAYDYPLNNLEPERWQRVLEWVRTHNYLPTPLAVAHSLAGTTPTNPVDLIERSAVNPISLLDGTLQNPCDFTDEDDDGGPIEHPERGICLGTIAPLEYTVWARVIRGRNGQRVGLRAQPVSIDGEPLDPWPANSIIAFKNVQRVGIWRNMSEKEIRVTLRAKLL